MAGKMNKLIVGGAVAVAAVAGGLAWFLNKKEKENSWDDNMEDFDDELESKEEDDTPVTREYVTIPKEPPHQEEETVSEEETAENESTEAETAAEEAAPEEETVSEETE